MSDLTKALNKMLIWLRKHRLSDISFLQPGLSNAEIDKLIESLPMQLPQDIRDLYREINGTKIDSNYSNFSCIFESWAFYSLDVVINGYKERIKRYKNNSQMSIFRFDSLDALSIFFNVELTDIGYMIINDKAPDASIVIFESCKAGDCNQIVKYASLTDMMLTISEYYENAYYINNNGDLTLDSEKALQIWRKYNSYRITEAPKLLF